MPAIGDIIELTVDILDCKLSAGMQGTIVHCHNSEAYEVELANDVGETLDFLALRPEQFIVVWRAETQKWVPLVEQAALIIVSATYRQPIRNCGPRPPYKSQEINNLDL